MFQVLKLGLPMVTALSVTHGFYTTTSRTGSHRKELKANVGDVLLYGMIMPFQLHSLQDPYLTKLHKNDSVCDTREAIFRR